jgi:2-dehydropantoate 2-reductase
MRILVFGAGAIGSVLGGLLAKAGHEVTLLGRAWHLDVVRQQGLTVAGLWGEHRIPACPVTATAEKQHLTTATSLEEVARQPEYRWVFVCVKAHQTAEAAKALTNLLGSRTLVCAFQNGLGNYEALIQRVAPARVALGRIIFGVEIEPGRVRVTVCADEVLIGAPDDRFPREQAAQLAAALQESGIPSRTTSTILVALWAKVLYNCALNGLSTLLEVPYGKLLEHALARRMMQAIIEEAYHVAATHHIRLEPSAAQAYLDLLFTRLIPDTAAHQSSMLQDLRRGKATEIEALNGALVCLAKQAGMQAPINALVTRLVHTKERFTSLSA